MDSFPGDRDRETSETEVFLGREVSVGDNLRGESARVESGGGPNPAAMNIEESRLDMVMVAQLRGTASLFQGIVSHAVLPPRHLRAGDSARWRGEAWKGKLDVSKDVQGE